MKTLIISSSLNPKSNSYLLCKAIEAELSKKDTEVTFLDLREYDIQPSYKEKTADMHNIEEIIRDHDNYVIGMAVHCYSLNDNLKALIDTSFPGEKHKLFGIACTAGGQKSYLATQHLVQIMINEFRMIPLPRIVYGIESDFDEEGPQNEHIKQRVVLFAEEFFDIGKKLI